MKIINKTQLSLVPGSTSNKQTNKKSDCEEEEDNHPESLLSKLLRITHTMPILEYLAASASVTNAGNVLYSAGSSSELNSKETEIRNRSINYEIVPPLPIVPFVKTTLLRLISSSYLPSSEGDSHVLYTTSSLGKTTASQAFITKLLPKTAHSRGLMITSTSSESYLTHLAKVLRVDEEETVLSVLVRGLRNVKPSPATVLIFDEFNNCGLDNCNIKLVDILMRYICQQNTGIILYVVTQSEEVASSLCGLNAWQKIGPMDGMTNPTREDVMKGVSRLPQNIKWLPEKSAWTLERLTLLIESRYKGVNFEKTEDGVISWLLTGMTPRAALVQANRVQCSSVSAMDEDEGLLE